MRNIQLSREPLCRFCGEQGRVVPATVVDHIQPISSHPSAHQITEYVLTNDARQLLDEYIQWFVTGTMREDGILHDLREEFLKLE